MQVVAKQQFSKQSDVYLLEIILWEMLTWQILWEGLTCFQVRQVFVTHEQPSDSQTFAGLLGHVCFVYLVCACAWKTQLYRTKAGRFCC